MGSFLNLVPLKVMVTSSCHFREFSFANLDFGLLIKELNLDLVFLLQDLQIKIELNES